MQSAPSTVFLSISGWSPTPFTIPAPAAATRSALTMAVIPPPLSRPASNEEAPRERKVAVARTGSPPRMRIADGNAPEVEPKTHRLLADCVTDAPTPRPGTSARRHRLVRRRAPQRQGGRRRAWRRRGGRMTTHVRARVEASAQSRVDYGFSGDQIRVSPDVAPRPRRGSFHPHCTTAGSHLPPCQSRSQFNTKKREVRRCFLLPTIPS